MSLPESVSKMEMVKRIKNMAEEQKTEGTQDTEQEDPSKELESRMNVAVRAQIKRELKPILAQLDGLKNLDQTIAGALEKAMAAKAEKPETKSEGKVDPQLKVLQEQMEKLTKQLSEERERARGLEVAQKKDKARGLLREALEAKGIKGPRATSLIALFESNGALQEDEDGRPVLAVTRARSKGAAPEELLFDVGAGVEDWSKTPDAADFLPAPGTGKTAPQQSQGRGPVHKTAPKYDKPPVTDDEAVRRTVQQLEAQGFNVNAILSGD